MIIFLLITFLSFLHSFGALADPEKVVLTSELLEERIKSPQLQDGILNLNLTSLEIDLTEENNQFRDEFYRQVQHYLNSSDKTVGLDFSHSLIKGDLFSNRLGILTILSEETLPQDLTINERKIIESNEKFSTQPRENIDSVILFRGSLKLNEVTLKGNIKYKSFISMIDLFHIFNIEEMFKRNCLKDWK